MRVACSANFSSASSPEPATLTRWPDGLRMRATASVIIGSSSTIRIRKARGDSSWDAGCGADSASAKSSAFTSGNVMLKVVPSPGAERTVMCPP